MTTLAVNKQVEHLLGDLGSYPMVASDIVYTRSAVGLVDASGHARPLTSADKFVGFGIKKADNSSGAAADIDVEVSRRGVIKLSVSGAVITDVKQPVYATDDNTFVFSPVDAVFIGFVHSFVSSGVVFVEYDATGFTDPYRGRIWETYSASSTLDKQDTGKGFWVDTDAQTMTLLTFAALTALDIMVMNGGPFGTIAVSIDPAAGDLISGPDDTGGDGGIMVNTKATARRGDYVKIVTGGDEGYLVSEKKGIWTIA
jgi:hypothetical protein